MLYKFLHFCGSGNDDHHHLSFYAVNLKGKCFMWDRMAVGCWIVKKGEHFALAFFPYTLLRSVSFLYTKRYNKENVCFGFTDLTLTRERGLWLTQF